MSVKKKKSKDESDGFFSYLGCACEEDFTLNQRKSKDDNDKKKQMPIGEYEDAIKEMKLYK